MKENKDISFYKTKFGKIYLGDSLKIIPILLRKNL